MTAMKKALIANQTELAELEKEWERLDSQGNQQERQRKIAAKMVDLERAIKWAENRLAQTEGE